MHQMHLGKEGAISCLLTCSDLYKEGLMKAYLTSWELVIRSRHLPFYYCPTTTEALRCPFRAHPFQSLGLLSLLVCKRVKQRV